MATMPYNNNVVVKKVELASIYCVQSFGIYMVKVFADSVCGRHGTTLGGDTLDDREITRLWLQYSLQPIAICTIRCIYIHTPIEVDVAIFTRFILCFENHPPYQSIHITNLSRVLLNFGWMGWYCILCIYPTRRLCCILLRNFHRRKQA